MGRSDQRPEAEKVVVNRLPHYGIFDYARLGYFSLSTKDTKFISREDSLTIDGVTETPGYFFGKFMKGLWVGKQDASPIELSYPYKAIPGKEPSAIYIDIRSAFRQIATSFGMEVFIHEGRDIAYGETIPEAECFNNKICRGLLVTGVSKSGSYQEWINRDIRTIKFSNPYYAPHISHCIWATLHAIQSVLSPFTIYGHTDGVIVPKRHFQRVTETLSAYGFNYTVKGAGSCEVFGVGSYRIGNVETRLLNKANRTRVSIRDDNAKWWLARYARGVALRNAIIHEELYDGIKPDTPSN